MKVIQQRSSVSFPMEGQTARKVRLQGMSDNKEGQTSRKVRQQDSLTARMV